MCDKDDEEIEYKEGKFGVCVMYDISIHTISLLIKIITFVI